MLYWNTLQLLISWRNCSNLIQQSVCQPRRPFFTRISLPLPTLPPTILLLVPWVPQHTTSLTLMVIKPRSICSSNINSTYSNKCNMGVSPWCILHRCNSKHQSLIKFRVLQLVSIHRRWIPRRSILQPMYHIPHPTQHVECNNSLSSTFFINFHQLSSTHFNM